MKIIKYDGTEQSKELIVNEQENNGFTLTAISNITEGNFLGFMDNPIIQPPPIEQQIEQLKQDNLILMDVLATMYEDMLEKGTV